MYGGKPYPFLLMSNENKKEMTVAELKAERDAIEKQTWLQHSRLREIHNALRKKTADNIEVGNIYQTDPHNRLIVNKIEQEDGKMIVEFYQLSVYDNVHKENNKVKKFSTSPAIVADIEPLNKKATQEDLVILEECHQATNRFVNDTDENLQKLGKSGVMDFD